MYVSNPIKRAFRSFRTPSEITLADRLDENEFYPFKQIHLGKLEFTCRYQAFYVSICGLIVSLIAAIAFISIGAIDKTSISSPLFPIPLFLIAISICGRTFTND
jgi:hypothetical protein